MRELITRILGRNYLSRPKPVTSPKYFFKIRHFNNRWRLKADGTDNYFLGDFSEDTGIIGEDIQQIIGEYLEKAEEISNRKEKENLLLEMLGKLISKTNEYAKEGDYYRVANYLEIAAYYLEEFDFKDAKSVYRKAIEFYMKYIERLKRNGQFSEAADIAGLVAELYHNKLMDYEKEKEMIGMCIDFNRKLLELQMPFSEPRKIALLLYKIISLYMKIGENGIAEKLIREKALPLAKANGFYDLVSNFYFALADIYILEENYDKADDIYTEAFDYFGGEEIKHKKEKKYYYLSEIYKILKNICSALRNRYDFIKYSRLEALSYLKMSEEIIGNRFDVPESGKTRIGYLYLGIANTLKDTELDNLESAAAFIMAANVFKSGGVFGTAGECYDAAAELFESEGLYLQSFKNYLAAADCGRYAENYEFRIEKLINAYNMAERYSVDTDLENLAGEIVRSLEEGAETEAEAGRFFIAGTLYLESLRFLPKLGYKKDSERTYDTLRKINAYYSEEYKRSRNKAKNKLIMYILALTAITNVALGNLKTAFKYMNEIKKYIRRPQRFEEGGENGNTFYEPSTAECYIKIIERIIRAYTKKEEFDIADWDRKTKKVFSNAEEIKLLVNFIFDRPG